MIDYLCQSASNGWCEARSERSLNFVERDDAQPRQMIAKFSASIPQHAIYEMLCLANTFNSLLNMFYKNQTIS